MVRSLWRSNFSASYDYLLPATPAMVGIRDTSGSNEVQAAVISSSRHIEDNGTKALQKAASLQAELLFPLVRTGYMEELLLFPPPRKPYCRGTGFHGSPGCS